MIMIYVVTYIDVEPSSISEAIELIHRYRDRSRAETGNRWTIALQENHRLGHFVTAEAWEDETARAAHESSEITAQFRSSLKAIQNSPNDQRVHQSFAVDSETPTAGQSALFVVTHVDVPPPRREETEVLLKNLTEQSRKDDGNLLYQVFQQNAPRTNHFTVLATWSGTKAFDSHETKPHTRQFREALGPMLGAPYDERLYQHLA
jgi:quinol monooxygenase YgiN